MYNTAAFITKIPISVRRLDLKFLKLNSYFTPLRLYRFASAAGALPADQTGQQQHLDRDGSPRGELSRSHSVSPDFGIDRQVRPQVRRSRLQRFAGLGDHHSARQRRAPGTSQLSLPPQRIGERETRLFMHAAMITTTWLNVWWSLR